MRLHHRCSRRTRRTPRRRWRVPQWLRRRAMRSSNALPLLLLLALRTGSGGADQRHAVPEHTHPVSHVLVRLWDLVERDLLPQRLPDPAIDEQLVVRARLLVVGPVRALEPLLVGPEVAEVERRPVPRLAGADHDHAAAPAEEDAGRQGRLPRVLDDDGRLLLAAEHLAVLRLEGAGAGHP